MMNEYYELLDRNGYVPSLIHEDGRCYFCKRTDRKLDRHEVFHGTGNREKSKRYGCWVELCHSCHEALHNGKTVYLEKRLKRDVQHMAMVHYVWSEDEFRNIFGKSFLGGSDDEE